MWEFCCSPTPPPCSLSKRLICSSHFSLHWSEGVQKGGKRINLVSVEILLLSLPQLPDVEVAGSGRRAASFGLQQIFNSHWLIFCGKLWSGSHVVQTSSPVLLASSTAAEGSKAGLEICSQGVSPLILPFHPADLTSLRVIWCFFKQHPVSMKKCQQRGSFKLAIFI